MSSDESDSLDQEIWHDETNPNKSDLPSEYWHLQKLLKYIKVSTSTQIDLNFSNASLAKSTYSAFSCNHKFMFNSTHHNNLMINKFQFPKGSVVTE